jgi:sugar phosphate isomerase/epimerase
MEIVYSDLCLINRDPLENVKIIAESGVGGVEIMLDGPFWNDMEGQMESLTPLLNRLPLDYSLHPPAWDINLTSENRAIREASCSEYRKAILFASRLKASYVVIHPGFVYLPPFDRGLAQERSLHAVKALNELAVSAGVRLAIENVGYGGTSSLFTQEEYLAFVRNLDENAGYLLDTGHAFLNGWDIPGLIRQMGSRLLALHLHDNNGLYDEHLPIGHGKIEWEPILKTLRELNHPVRLVLEYCAGTPLVEMGHGKEFILTKLR